MPTNATGLLQPRPPPVACSDAGLLGMVMQHFVACKRICKRLGCPYDLDTLQGVHSYGEGSQMGSPFHSKQFAGPVLRSEVDTVSRCGILIRSHLSHDVVASWNPRRILFHSRIIRAFPNYKSIFNMLARSKQAGSRYIFLDSWGTRQVGEHGERRAKNSLSLLPTRCIHGSDQS
jgi:hypothetical protein